MGRPRLIQERRLDATAGRPRSGRGLREHLTRMDTRTRSLLQVPSTIRPSVASNSGRLQTQRRRRSSRLDWPAVVDASAGVLGEWVADHAEL